jgi:adenylate cyclase
MALEIERKFLVATDAWRDAVTSSVSIVQGYIAETDSCSARVRIQGEFGSLNFKGLTIGSMRDEFEFPIPVDEAREMMARFCGSRTIEKVRHHVTVDGHVWEVDEFGGANAGLVVAEVELGSLDETPTIPPWAGEEVTDDVRYYNIRLVEHPWTEWGDG